jgi:hypothetical protein
LLAAFFFTERLTLVDPVNALYVDGRARRITLKFSDEKNQPQAVRPWLVFNCVLL